MERSTVEVLGIRIDDMSTAEMLAALKGFVCTGGGGHQISTVNVEYLMLAHRDLEFAQVVRNSALRVPDSAGILWAARWLGHPLRERVTGSDGVYAVAELCAREGFRLFLLGAGEGVAARAARILQERSPGLCVCGALSGSPLPEHELELAERVRRAQADVLLVAYPSAMQEKWIARNLERTGVSVAMGVGAAFDFCAGVQARAPRWMQRVGLEWFYRLLREPWRWRRMLALPQAAWLVFLQRFGWYGQRVPR
jgi:N-acetylglucosaminyldiphosphoundecaprenol N-acetyl-beta-D-mannosaminyltransferase